VERVACLAYYLAHFRDTPHFQTIDISKLNTEAAQLKFANAANSVSNAVESGLLVPAGKGKKQISAVGERFVDALPDREDAKAVLSRMRKRRSRKKPRNTKKARQVTK
jgi:c-di-GMP-binding flagellar brake protein YcgR